ncbi:hypothetical protein ASF26_14615 [Methylobacterium sp. Leaf93]|nr:hypothetical protein ASF26_14615 [Methylobacterium sp. Leaf93]
MEGTAMLRCVALSILALAVLFGGAAAEAPPPIAPGVPVSVTLQPVAVYDKDGKLAGSPESPMTVLSTPFVRSGTGDPIIFDGITTTAKQFAITKPADATSYRFVNPCNVDVRIRKVSSLSESVTLRTGTRFLARSSETLGTSQPTFVSLIATAAPTGECAPELQYGRGG